MNICGVLVHCAPGTAATVEQALMAMPGVEVHHRTEDARLIVTVEDTGAANAGDTILAVHRLPGVLSAALTFHSFEELAEGAGAAGLPAPRSCLCTGDTK